MTESNTAALLALLKRHYIKPGQDLPGGVFLPEVGQNGSWGAGSRCDAIYVGFTSSSGRMLVGHELKVSRADWLNELNKPGKADQWADQCHEWWLVVPNPAIVHEGELPAGWGLMYPGRSKTRMQVHTPAERKDPRTHQPSWDSVRSIIARHDTLRAETILAARAKATKDAQETINERVERLVALQVRDQPDAAELAARLKSVEEALGAPIDWSKRESNLPLYGHVGLDQIAEMAGAVRALGSVQKAVLWFTQGWNDPIGNTRDALDRLDAAFNEMRAADSRTAEETPP
uniref:MmcB-like DNA repair protein n=1 Tax=Mycobacterium phage JustASigh TaxID=3158894 RepID=A0AAU8GQG9_9CAUD